MTELQQGIRIKDRYVLKEFKGSGSFGEVWLAHDEFLEIEVAVKLYISLDSKGVEEFKTEYKTAYGLSHPNLLAATYFDVWEQRPFLVMKYCSKGSVGNIAGNTSERRIWQFIHDVAAGLAFLHEQEPEPIIHQDIKPDNILIDEQDRFLITDFGISRKIRSTMRKQSKRGITAGATAYMGPERFSKDSTPVLASDIWSLGASIYELATGELPFCGMGGGMQMNGAELPELGNNWSKGVNFVMQSCLAKDPWKRPTAQQIVDYTSIVLKGKIPQLTWLEDDDEDGDMKDVISNREVVDCEDSGRESRPSSNKNVIRNRWVGLIILMAVVTYFMFLSERPLEKEVVRSEYRNQVEDNRIVSIKDIVFRNMRNGVDVISNYGSPLYASKLKFLSAKIIYDGFVDKPITLYVKIITPQGNLDSRSTSPPGFSFKNNNIYIQKGENNSETLTGWGSNSRGYYSSGTYRYEIWYDKTKLLFSKEVVIH